MNQRNNHGNLGGFFKAWWAHYKKGIICSFSGAIPIFAAIFGILSYFSVELNDIKATIESALKAPSYILLIIMFVIFVGSLLYVFLEISRRIKSKKLSLELLPLLLIITSLSFIIIIPVYIINLIPSENTSLDPPVNIGVVYNSKSLDSKEFERYVDDQFRIIKGRVGSNMNVNYVDISNKNNIFNEIDTFATNNRVKYLIIASPIDSKHYSKILSRNRSKYITIELQPIDIPTDYKDHIVAMYYAANREVSAIVKYLANNNFDKVVLIHPAKNQVGDYQHEFKSSLIVNAGHHDIDVKAYTTAEIDSVIRHLKDLKQENVPPIILLTNQPNIMNLFKYFSDASPLVICSSNMYNEISYSFLHNIDIHLPLPWPQKKYSSTPLSYALSVSAVEAVSELDNEMYENNTKINKKIIRLSLFKNYSNFNLIVTQKLLGQTRLSNASFPHFIVDDLEIMKLK